MALIDDLKSDLKEFEGIRAIVYDDKNGTAIIPGYVLEGNPTVGVGRCLNKNPLSDDEIYYLLNNDSVKIIQICSTYNWYGSLTPMQRRAICNMIFQLGAKGFADFTRMLSCLDNKDIQGAILEARNSNWYKETPQRAEKILAMLGA